MAIYKYWLRDSGQTEDNAFKVDSECLHAKDIAGDAAHDYHYNHGGYEATWPLKITIELQSGQHKTFDIDREVQPVFFATEC